MKILSLYTHYPSSASLIIDDKIVAATHEERFTRIKQINHTFNSENQELFDQTYFFDYPFRTKSKELNYFKGKPVEGCFSHEGKYLWG